MITNRSTISINPKEIMDSFHDDDDGSVSAIDHAAPDDEPKEVIAKEENKAVNCSKWTVCLALLITTAVVGTGTYFFAVKGQRNDFDTAYDAFAREVQDVTEINSQGLTQQIEHLSTTITSYALDTDATWPFVTLPHFDVRTRAKKEYAGAEMVIFAPIVGFDQKDSWLKYTSSKKDWIQQDLAYSGSETNPGLVQSDIGVLPREVDTYPVYRVGNETEDLLEDSDSEDEDSEDESEDEEELEDVFVPIWQYGPGIINASLVNMDLLSSLTHGYVIGESYEERKIEFSEVGSFEYFLSHTRSPTQAVDEVRSYVSVPVFDDFTDDADIVGFIIGIEPWQAFFSGVLPEGTGTLLVSIQDHCGADFTYSIDGVTAEFSEGDLHSSKYDSYARPWTFGQDGDGDGCYYDWTVYPTEEFEEQYITKAPLVYTVVVVMAFVFTAGVFILYDFTVQRRQAKVAHVAEKSSALVSSLFPGAVGQQLIDEAAGDTKRKFGVGNRSNLKSFLNDETSELTKNSKPLAELFPDTTIFFADIAGFTSWSSSREPSMVFTLLESLYGQFDELAAKRRIFKVETIGDCYVAVSGLPDPNPQHHLAMARFARDCLTTFECLTQELERELGPGTSDLGLRIGLHSGPVTAGVLRGDRARFQLFGDSVNTAARMESNGQRGRIHLSQATADLLVDSGKSSWITTRSDKITAKGKGELQTFWLNIKSAGSRSSASNSDADPDIGASSPVLPIELNQKEKVERMVDYNTEVLSNVLSTIVARRKALGLQPSKQSELRAQEQRALCTSRMTIDELEDTIALPGFDATIAGKQSLLGPVRAGKVVVEQMRHYIATIASLYRPNPFHNFQHASTVALAATKLHSRISAPELEADNELVLAKKVHVHTLGITSDPMIQFTSILAALVHDVDHGGISNADLIKEHPKLAAKYANKSVAEQHSVDLAFHLLMDPKYLELRMAIYETKEEFSRFRSLLIQSVLATDIMDKSLGLDRRERWNRAFADSVELDLEGQVEDDVNRKATIVIEHLIQASDVAHTMQHWHVYQQWMKNLFYEMMLAYKEGRSDTDPSKGWYKGEMDFFDYYIIPLARKLKTCGVFGVSSEENLNYAIANRKEWEERGQGIVAGLLKSFNSFYFSHSTGTAYVPVAPEAARADEHFVHALVSL